ncbi:uncharacterized protein isoform X2 [Choristoneura fumiferana]|uniref:uncharacterized protein isoform X2 n=1 Tax=Choristoneura fumiferana TaxID=7141 RepID=UPI003D15EE85
MLKILLLCCVLTVAKSHNNQLVNDADIQSALIPQELNPAFVPDDEKPWRSELPLPRIRRDLDLEIPESTTMQQVKTYSRIIAGVVLALTAVVEIIVYVVEIYYA